MLPVFLIEPAASVKRRNHADVLLHAKMQVQPGLQDIKAKLKKLREDSVCCQISGVDAVMEKLSLLPDIKVVLARDADQAVQAIEAVSDGPMIAVNKSSVITKELVPSLTAESFDVVETYGDEQQVCRNRFRHPWQLPQLWNAASFESVAVSGQLSAFRKAHTEKHGSKNFTALLGVSALSAEEGAVFFLQHSGNIRKIYEQARQVVLVAGLDKIVKNSDDALFQIKCMTAFGLEPLLLGIRENDGKPSRLDALPYGVFSEKTKKRICIILFDNGRSKLLQSPYRELLHCISCRACARDCAASRLMEKPGHWSPKEYAYFLASGKSPFEVFCLQCKTCQSNCPLDIDLPGMIFDAQKKSGHGGLYPLNEAWFGKMGTLEKWGSHAPAIFNSLANARPIRWVAEKTFDINKEISFPNVSRSTFAKWFHSNEPEP
jgi:L-lactate utilization protein LutB